jgi:hypothetical protein
MAASCWTDATSGAIDDEEPEDSTPRFKFPYGDFDRLHCCGVLSAQARAGHRWLPVAGTSTEGGNVGRSN